MDNNLFQDLLLEWQKNPDDYSVHPFQKGGNNQIFLLTSESEKLVIKKYPKHHENQFDRRRQEWDFLKLLQKCALNESVPNPIFISQNNDLAIYEFIDGQKLSMAEIDQVHIEQCGHFILNINRDSVRSNAGHIRPASDSGFSFENHFSSLKMRISKFESIECMPSELMVLLNKITDLSQQIIKKSDAYQVALSREERCLSPSDFGFQNILQSENQTLRFIDFEYAGWDDPAKLAADFFFQPEISVNEKFYDLFLEACLGHIKESQRLYHRKRAKCLRPLFGLKWCGIILNPYLKEWQFRQGNHFSKKQLKDLQLKRLDSAQKMISKTEELLT